jgi:hypothetical protein
MVYYLVHRFGPKDKPQFQKEEFSTEPEAVIKARILLATDDREHFLIEDEKGKTVMTDRQIRSFCKAAKPPQCQIITLRKVAFADACSRQQSRRRAAASVTDPLIARLFQRSRSRGLRWP